MTSDSVTTTFDRPAPAAVLARSRSRRKRFLIVGIAALAVLGVTMGVSFLGQSGSVTLSVSGGSGSSSSLVYMPSSTTSITLPSHTSASTPSILTSTEYTQGTPTSADPTVATIHTPSWAPTANSAGSVSQGGDIAIIDASQTTGPVVVNLYVTNLAALQQDYSSFAFPINVYETVGASGSGGTSTWAASSSVVTQSPFSSYLTDTSGVISFSLPAGKYYDITMEGGDSASGVGGGSFYCISTSTTGGAALAPSFFITANPTA